MILKTVSVSKSMRLSRDFCSVEALIALEAELENGEDEIDAINTLSEDLDLMLSEKIDDSLLQLNQKMQGD